MTAPDIDRHQLLADYAEHCVDDMDLETLSEIVTTKIIEDHDDTTDDELIALVKKYYPELIEGNV